MRPPGPKNLRGFNSGLSYDFFSSYIGYVPVNFPVAARQAFIIIPLAEMNVSEKAHSYSFTAHSLIVKNDALDAAEWDLFRNGDRAALNRIFEKHARQLFAYGKKFTSDQGLIADCLQDLFVELWVKRAKLTPEVKTVKFYLIKSVRRRILRRLSADGRIIGRRIPDEYNLMIQSNIESQMIDDQLTTEISLCVKTSLSALSEGQREAIHLKFYENLSYDEIASIMNTNVKAVYNLVSKSIISLRKVLKAHPVLKRF